MRFTRDTRIPFAWTPRKAAAAARRNSGLLSSLPLLAPLIAPTLPTPDQEHARREARWDADSASYRSRRASRWRAARRQLYALPEDERLTLLARWNRSGCPADPHYLLDLLHQHTKR